MRTLSVPDALLDDGMAFYLMKDGDAQITVELKSRLSRMVAQSSRAGGYLVGPFSADEVGDGESPISGGAIRLPAASLRTGTSNDQTLASSMVLDAVTHSDIGFVFGAAKEVRRSEGELADSTVFDMKIIGTLLFKDRFVPINADVQLTFFLSGGETFSRGTGDLARLTGGFDVALEELGLGPRIASRFGATARVEFFLMFSTPDPERALIPPSTPEAFRLENRYLVKLRDFEDVAGAYAAGEELMKAAWDDPVALRQFAVTGAFDSGSGRRLFGQAKRAAERAVDLGGESPDALAINVLARLAAETGEMKKAIRLQKWAIDLATGGRAARAKAAMEADLGLYERLQDERSGKNAGKKQEF